MTRIEDRDGVAATMLFRAFTVAWGLAALFHLEFGFLASAEGPMAAKATGALVAGAAVLAVRRPGIGTLCLLAVAQLADVARGLPAVPNHWLLAGFVNLAILLAATSARRPAGIVAAMGSPVMVAVVVFYLWTGAWKLNADFVRPDVSCAAASVDRLVQTFPWIPDSNVLRRAVIDGTLTMELLGPLLLLVPVTRGVAVVAFLAFHLLIGLDAVKIYLNFGSVMFALLLLFLPDGAVLRFARIVPAGTVRRVGRAAVAYPILALAAVALAPGTPAFLLGRWVLWLGYAVTLLGTVALAVTGAPSASRWLPGARWSPVWLVPVLVFVNGLAPALGLKTRSSWQMYSNARIEADASNHYLFGPSLDFLGYLREEPVRVLDSTSAQLRDVAGTALRLPWVEFRRRVQLDPDASVIWERAGERHVTPRAGNDPLLSAPVPFAVRKLLPFRPVGLDAATRCDW